jgi:hypothetical protein
MYSRHDWVVEPKGDVEGQVEAMFANTEFAGALDIDLPARRDFDSDDYELSDSLTGPLGVLSGPVDDED